MQQQAFSITPLSKPSPRTDRSPLIAHIKRMLVEQNAVLVAHYYTAPELQELADETGGYVSDSLDMARFGHEHAAKTLIVAGVRFMAKPQKFSIRKNAC